MRLTRRGWAVAAVAAAGTLMAALFGARSLNAVVFPCVVALVAAVTQLYRLEEPAVDRTLPSPGFPDEEGTVTLSFDAPSTFVGRVTDSLPASLDGDSSAETTVGREPVSYTVRYRRRGEHPVGPVSFRARDVLGLAQRRLTAGTVDYLLVYPRVHDLTNAARRDLLTVIDSRESTARDEFDRLREYVRGDSLRDVHWKTSAKRDDLVVKEFTADERRETVTVAVGGDSGRGDEMAEAAGSVTLALLRAGVPVTLATPTGTVSVGLGEHKAALEHLAGVSTGAVPDEDAAVTVDAHRRATVVRAGDVETTFDRMVASTGGGRGVGWPPVGADPDEGDDPVAPGDRTDGRESEVTA